MLTRAAEVIHQMFAGGLVRAVGRTAHAARKHDAAGDDADKTGIHSKLPCHSHENPSSDAGTIDLPAALLRPLADKSAEFQAGFTG